MSRPGQIDFLSRVAPLYDSVVRAMGFSRMWRVVAEAGEPKSWETVLDVCTGTGGVARELARLGARVTGVDLARGMLRSAERSSSYSNSRPSFVRMDAQRLAFRDDAFRLVTCAMALHEMSEAERQAVMGEIGRVASNRIVICEYRVPVSPLRRFLFLIWRSFEYIESDDFAGFVAQDFRKRLEQAGLVVDRSMDVGAYRVWCCRPTVRPAL